MKEMPLFRTTETDTPGQRDTVTMLNRNVSRNNYRYHIALVHRYIRIFSPHHAHLLDYSAHREPSFGMWLRFTSTTIQLVSVCAPRLSHDDLDVTWVVDSPLKLRLALRQILDLLEWNAGFTTMKSRRKHSKSK
jgi:hypothetical protein